MATKGKQTRFMSYNFFPEHFQDISIPANCRKLAADYDVMNKLPKNLIIWERELFHLYVVHLCYELLFYLTTNAI